MSNYDGKGFNLTATRAGLDPERIRVRGFRQYGKYWVFYYLGAGRTKGRWRIVKVGGLL